MFAPSVELAGKMAAMNDEYEKLHPVMDEMFGDMRQRVNDLVLAFVDEQHQKTGIKKAVIATEVGKALIAQGIAYFAKPMGMSTDDTSALIIETVSNVTDRVVQDLAARDRARTSSAQNEQNSTGGVLSENIASIP